MITLKTLPEATAQEVYNQVRDHLLTQGEKAWNGQGCEYRTERGLKCAAGCLIGDDEYQRNIFEGAWWRQLVENEYVPPHHFQLICDLQDIHDSWSADIWIKGLQQVADKHNLTP